MSRPGNVCVDSWIKPPAYDHETQLWLASTSSGPKPIWTSFDRLSRPLPEEFKFLCASGHYSLLNVELGRLDLTDDELAELEWAICDIGAVIPQCDGRYRLRYATCPYGYTVEPVDGSENVSLPADWLACVRTDSELSVWVGRLTLIPPKVARSRFDSALLANNHLTGFDPSGYVESVFGWMKSD